MTHNATCACGSVTLCCSGDPAVVSLCHCKACQKRTGSAYGLAAFFDQSDVRISGATHQFRRASDSGFDVVFHFCPACGSTVYWTPLRKPGMIAVAVGAFADPDFPAPGQEVHTDCRHGWVPPLSA